MARTTQLTHTGSPPSDEPPLSCRKILGSQNYIALTVAVEHDGSMPASIGSAARRQIGPGGVWQPLAAHGGAEADEAQRARHGDGNPACPERHIDAIQGDGPPHHNPDQLQKRDQGKDGGGKRAKGSYGHCPSPMAHEDVLVPYSQNGEGPARRPLPLKQGSGLTESFSMCRTTAVSRRRESGSL